MRLCDNGHAPARVQSGERCPACSRRRESGRPSRQARGYGLDHTSARNVLARALPAPCGYAGVDPQCPGGMIGPDERWVAAHVEDGRPELGWMHAHPACNERSKSRGVGGQNSGDGRRAVPAPSQLRPRTGLAVPADPVVA